MDEQLYLFARKAALRALISKNKWGGSHTHYKHLYSGIPKHQRGEKEVRKAINDLAKEGKILYKKTVDEPHVSLNPIYAKEIKEEAFN